MNDLGSVIATVRRSRGLTQAQLATQAGITQAALSRYEGNLREPDSESVVRLAEALGVTPGFLNRARGVFGAMAVDAHMRRRRTAKATVWKQLEAELNEIRLHCSLLDDHVNLGAAHTVPRFDPVDVMPDEAARLVRMQWRMPIGPVRNLIGWMEAAGCWIAEREWGTNRIDGLSQWISDRPVVLANASMPTDRKRLTLAHELGHLVLHSNEIVEDVEQQANSFAAEFLMPREVIRPRLRNLKIESLASLKREWGVSMAALIERSYSLGLLKQESRSSLYKQFSSRGWRTREPISEELEPEVATIASLVGEQLRAGGLSDEEIAELAGYADADSNALIPSGTVRSLRAI